MSTSWADRVNILVVDDHPENILALEATLSKPDYGVVSAMSGPDALRKILHQDFAVILLDVVMPGMDGFETARFIRQREVSKDIPIIFLTATGADVGLVYKGYSVGAVDYLVKPIDPDIVRAKVAVFVDLFRKRRQIIRQEERLREAERVRSAEALRESEAQYEATFNDAAVGIAHATTDGRWLRANQRFCDVIGYPREEILGRSFQDVVHPDDLPTAIDAFQRMLNGAIDSHRGEERFVHKDGRVLWLNLTVSLLRDSAGRAKTFITVIEDVTERKLTEERQRFLAVASECLLSSLAYRSTLVDVVRLAVPALADWCVVDGVLDEGGVPAEIAMAHVDPDAAERLRRLRGRLSGDPRHGVLRVLRTGQPELATDVTDAVLQSMTDDPEVLTELRGLGMKSLMVTPLVARDNVLGAITFVSAGSKRRYGAADLAMAEDLSHRVAFAIDNARLYQEAQDAISARDEFLSIASHELRTPLTPLQIQLQRLLGDRTRQSPDSISPERLRHILQRSERQVQRLAALVDNLLDVSRISSGSLRLFREELDLTEVARDVASRFGEELSRAGCELAFHSTGPVVGTWDRLRLEQVLTNLLTNAIKYGDGKPIEITTDAEANRARLRVRDSGIGIEHGKLSRIFERFERAVPARSYGGLGLGLYIARQIVDAHGGTIGVSSEPGVGSLFTVELPLQVADAHLADAEERVVHTN